MAQVFVGGVAVGYREAGNGPGVVLLHSAGSTSAQWKRLMERLAGRYRVLAPDLLGYGGTGHWPPGRRDLIEDEAAIAAAMVDVLGEPAHVVGHSYGAHVAMRMALEHPRRARSLALVEPSMAYLLAHAGESAAYAEIRGVADRFFAFARSGELDSAARAFVDYWMGGGTFDRMSAERKATAMENVRKLVYQWPYSLERASPGLADYARLAVPALLVQGGSTTFAQRRLMAVMRDVLPHADFVEVPGAGHMSAVTHADAVNEAIERHLVRHTAQPAMAV